MLKFSTLFLFTFLFVCPAFAQPQSEVEPEAEPEAEPGPIAAPAPEPAPEVAPEPEAAPEPAPEVEPAPEPEPEPEPELAPETVLSSDLDAEEPSPLEALKSKAKFKVGARLYGLWTMSDEFEQPLHDFSVNMARLKFSWTQGDIIEAVIKLDADQLLEDADDAVLLRDLYINVQPAPWLGFKLGQFKRPFSGIEMRSRAKLPGISRGIVNDYNVEHLMYGGRDIGLMLGGRLLEKIRLDYSIGVFNGMGMNAKELGLSGFKDIAGRLSLKPAKWLSLGMSGSFKFIEDGDLEHFVDLDSFADTDPDDYPEYVDPDNPELTLVGFQQEHEWMTGMSWMAGMDVGMKFGKFRLMADGTMGENWWFKDYPYVWGGTLLLSYKHKLKKGLPLWVEPVVMGEVLTILSDWNSWRNRMWQVAPGVNLHIGKHVRLMVGGEFTFAQGTEADIDGSRNDGLWPNEWPGDFVDAKRLLVQLAFSI